MNKKNMVINQLKQFLCKKDLVKGKVINRIKLFIEKFKKVVLKERSFFIKEYTFLKEELREDLWLIEDHLKEMEEKLFLSGFIDKFTFLSNFLQHFSFIFMIDFV